MIPRLAVEEREARHFLMRRWRRAHEREIAAFGQHDEMAARKHHLAVAIAAALPFQNARRRIDARENRFVESIDEAVMQHRARELVLHPDVAPDFANGESVCSLRKL